MNPFQINVSSVIKFIYYLGWKKCRLIFATRYANEETYKTHKKTFLRKVCSVMYVTI